MSRKFKEARKRKSISSTQAALLLQVSQPTISAWERGVKNPSIESLEKMAELYNVTTDYLLGRDNNTCCNQEIPIDIGQISLFNGKPVWSNTLGWLLVNTNKNYLINPLGEIFHVEEVGNIYFIQPGQSTISSPDEEPLDKNNLKKGTEIWVEPISSEHLLRDELRGYYKVMDNWVENSSGNRFMIDRYGANWIAFLPSVKPK